MADLNKYTDKAREAVLGAQSLAQEANHNQVEPEHLLAALLSQSDGVVPQLIDKLGLSARAFNRVLRIARTIADIEAAESISAHHVSEAIQYRSLDRSNLFT